MTDSPPEPFKFREVTHDTDMEIMDTLRLIEDCGTELDAAEFIDDYAAWLKRNNPEIDDAHKLAQDNLGYLCGYLDSRQAKRIYDFFNIAHPLLGADPGKYTAREIFEMGVNWAKSLKDKDNE